MKIIGDHIFLHAFVGHVFLLQAIIYNSVPYNLGSALTESKVDFKTVRREKLSLGSFTKSDTIF